MIVVRGHVRKGRLIVDEPTDLPDGSEIELVAEEPAVPIDSAPPADEPLTPEDIARLKTIRATNEYVSHDEVRAKLDARKR